MKVEAHRKVRIILQLQGNRNRPIPWPEVRDMLPRKVYFGDGTKEKMLLSPVCLSIHFYFIDVLPELHSSRLPSGLHPLQLNPVGH